MVTTFARFDARAIFLGFLAGAASVLVFHQLAVMVVTGRVGWSMAPIPPFGVPSILNTAFWGGLWGVLLAWLAPRMPGGVLFLVAAFLFGAIAPVLVGWYIVPLFKGGALGPRTPWYNGPLINGVWGLGAGVFLLLFGRMSDRRSLA